MQLLARGDLTSFWKPWKHPWIRPCKVSALGKYPKRYIPINRFTEFWWQCGLQPHMFPLPKTIARFASRKTDSFCSTAKYLRDNLAHSHSKLKVPNHRIGTPMGPAHALFAPPHVPGGKCARWLKKKYFELNNSWGCRPNSKHLLPSIAALYWARYRV